MTTPTLKQRLQSAMDKETLAMESEDLPVEKWDDRLLRALILEFRGWMVEYSSHKSGIVRTDYTFLIDEAHK